MCIGVWVHLGHGKHMEVREQLVGGQSSLPNVWFLGTELRLCGLVVRATTHGAILLAYNLSFQKTLQKLKSLSPPSKNKLPALG